MDDEARIIASDLMALHRDGVIGGADDPEALFYGVLIHLFDTRYAGKVSPVSERQNQPAITNKWAGPVSKTFAGCPVITPTLSSLEELEPLLRKLAAQPGSIILVAFETFHDCNDCRVSYAWLSAAERKVVRKALERARKRRSRSAVAA